MNIDTLKALSDPSRFKIMLALQKCEVCACVLPDIINKKQPTVSNHLKILHKFGLINMRKDGVKRLYSLSPLGKKVLDDLSKW